MSSQEPTGTLEVLNEAGRGVRVEFHESGDRFGHVILAIHGEKRFPVLTSVESNKSQLLPHIPCFSEFHQQEQALFLTGASSAGHWSMSVQIADTLSKFLSFDVACRLKESGHHVGSEYLLAETADCHLNEVGTMAMIVDPAGDAPSLQLLGGNQIFEATCLISHAENANLRLSSPGKSPETLPATVRWRYGVGVC